MPEIQGLLSGLDLAPANEAVEIMQNVRTLITTPLATAPLHRSVGIRQEAQDAPVNLAMAQISADVVAAVKRHEPRAEVAAVTFDGDMAGRLTPRVRIKRKTP